MRAPWICWIAPLTLPRIATFDSSGEVRSSNGFRPKKTMPSFGAAEKPAIDRPGNATESMMPGTPQRDVAHAPDHRLGAVERGARRQLRDADQVLLVGRRHEAGRDAREQERASAPSSTA